MVMGWREELEGEKLEFEDRKGIIGIKIKSGKVWWKIAGVYVNEDLEDLTENMRNWIDEKEEGTRYLIGGDFNVRTGEEGELWDDEKEEEDKEERKRKTKDKKITGKEKKFCKALEEAGWGIVNGCTRGDEKSEWTYVGGRGKTVIDYVISNVESKGEIVEMKVGEEVDSDHLPLIVTIKMEGGKRRRCKYGIKKSTRLVWIKKEMKIKKKEKPKERWWNDDCKRKKGEVKEEMLKWRKGEGSKENYKKKKSEYKKLCEEKKLQEKKMLGEVEWRVREEIGEDRIEDNEEDINREEFENVIRRLKKGKAAGSDGLENEIWKWGGGEVKEKLWKMCKRVWRGEGMPEE
ncbi:golgin subfamily A member 6-like protein 2 [Cardiocondyla obscurior]|uniref:golgin subfamily A member 6-like protein 2 n=1 Tax=Cardiocondyla obscurior TaxID=286306 RepID=UPI0039656C37